MQDPYHPLYRSIVRIRDRTGEIVGAGFLATQRIVCTCAHVVCDALALPRETVDQPTLNVSLDFPYLSGAKADAHVVVWIPMLPHEGGGDIAVLRLTSDPPAGARPARLLPVSNLSGRAFAAFGFPSTFDMGQNAYGVLHDRLANSWVELQGTSAQGYRVQRGYSGAPVWDTQGHGVVGMVVAEDSDQEAKVAFLLPNDLIQQACPDIKQITFSQLFKPLTEGLLGLPGSPLSGVEQFLREYLGTPERPAPFGGRDKQLTTLDRWLATPEQPYALLVAEAGRGKSALLAQWVATVADEHRAEVILVPISIRFSTSLKSVVVSLLGARIRHIHDVKADPPRDVEGWLAEIDYYLREDRSSNAPLLIVLDGADEAVGWQMGQDLRFPPQPGNGTKVLVSARSLANCDAAGWMRRLEWQGLGTLIDLPVLDKSGVAKVLQAMSNPLAKLATQVDVVRELYRLSEGDPLLVRLYVEALIKIGDLAAFLTPEKLKDLKPGLKGYFDQWWADQHRQWGSSAPLKEPAVQILLNLLACALGPLSTPDLQALMESGQFDYLIVEEALETLARFIVGDGQTQGYVFSHPRLNQYFHEKLSPRERLKWQGRFLDYGKYTLAALTNRELDPGVAPFYPVRYYGTHLEQANADPEQFHELVSQGWMRAWEAHEGTFDGFLSDLARAWKRAEAASAQAQSTENRGRAIGRQCRYALIVASIKSLAGNIPPALLAALVEKGVWTPIQGLASARQIPDGWRRAEVLVDLAPHLSEPLPWEALADARAIADEYRRAQALAGLVPRLGELGYGEEALAAAREIADDESRAQALVELAPHLPEPLQVTVLQEALAVVRAIADEERRAQALAGLAPHLPEPLQVTVLQEALAAARAIANDESRAQSLAGLAPHVKQLPVVRLFSLWCETFRILATRTRPDLLSDIQTLVPVIAVLGGKEALIATMQAIIEVGKWFP
jgi:Trypsin-like peptidase domain